MSNAVYFATSNPGKVESLQNILRDAELDIPIDMLEADCPEEKSIPTTEHVAREAARWCAQKYDKQTLVTDTGIFIDALNSFPGINTAFVLDHIGADGVLKLLKDADNRRVRWTLSLGYAAPDQRPHVFTASIDGTVPQHARGSHGFGFDPIFIPDGYDQTLAEAESVQLRDRVTPFRAAVLDFGTWYRNQTERSAVT